MANVLPPPPPFFPVTPGIHSNVEFRFCRSQVLGEDRRSFDERKSFKICLHVLFFSFLSYLPSSVELLIFDRLSSFVVLIQHFNNFSNFFIYLWFDDDFRKWVLRRNKVVTETLIWKSGRNFKNRKGESRFHFLVLTIIKVENDLFLVAVGFKTRFDIGFHALKLKFISWRNKHSNLHWNFWIFLHMYSTCQGLRVP